MLAQILPGFREIRGPLAAGFLWLLLGFLAFHGAIAGAHGKVKEIVELGEKLNSAALAAAASFVAYLVGSVSEDAFGWIFRGIQPIVIERIEAEALRTANEFARMSNTFRETQLIRIENESERDKAEADLRTAIVPPLVALSGYMSFAGGAVWLLLLIPGAAFTTQARLRRSDLLVAERSMFQLRQLAGVPPTTVAEAKAASMVEPNEPRFELFNFVRTGKRLLNYSVFPTDLADAWEDDVVAFLKRHPEGGGLVNFLTVSAPTRQQSHEQQITILEGAFDYSPRTAVAVPLDMADGEADRHA